MNNALVVANEVRQQLATVTTVEEAKELRDRAEAIRRYAKDSHAGLKQQNAAAQVRFLCERKAGELLLQVQHVQGQRDHTEPGLLATLTTSGIALRTAYRWMGLAQVPEPDLVRFSAQCDVEGEELTATLVYDVLVRRGSLPAEDIRTLSVDEMRQQLLTWHILDVEDLADLPPEVEWVLVREVRNFYETYCFDDVRGKQPDAQLPLWCNPGFLRMQAKEVIADVRARRIDTPAALRRHLRGWIDDATRRATLRASGHRPKPRPISGTRSWPKPPGRSLVQWFDDVVEPVESVIQVLLGHPKISPRVGLKLQERARQLRQVLEALEQHLEEERAKEWGFTGLTTSHQAETESETQSGTAA